MWSKGLGDFRKEKTVFDLEQQDICSLSTYPVTYSPLPSKTVSSRVGGRIYPLFSSIPCPYISMCQKSFAETLIERMKIVK